MEVHGIILAAGSSRRMGSPKALLSYRGETFVARVRRMMAAHCRSVVVVGPPGAPWTEVENPEPERGMLSSLKCGLRSVPESAGGALFTLVDLPTIQPATVASLIAAGDSEKVVIPRCRGRRGHPVFVGCAHFAALLEAPEDETPKSVLARCAPVYVDCDDEGIARDADTPAEYQELLAHD